MKCQKIRSDLKAYIDGELGFVARWRVARHLAVCVECREEHKAMKELTEVLKGVAGVEVPSGFRQRVQARLDAQTASTPAPTRRLSGRMKFAVAMIPLVIIAAFAFNEYRLSSRREMMVGIPESRLEANHKEVAGSFVPKDVDSKRLEGSVPAPVPSSSERHADEYQPDRVSPSKARVPVKSSTVASLLVIRTANLTLEVKDFQQAYDEATRICQSIGGYITDSSASAEETMPTSGSLVIRVPEDAFDDTIKRLTKLGVLKSREISGQDVTTEVVDLDSRLRNLRAEEAQYRETMDRAKEIPDIVAVSNELYRVRSEIETIEGRVKYLRTAAAMATIHVTLKENERLSRCRSRH
ncbi:MAG TPA: DUF4349 domain-containing protein [Armatimonadota bacterium]|nr:DUF4349 domain-containing protein [Armatimonadota bacterium]